MDHITKQHHPTISIGWVMALTSHLSELTHAMAMDKQLSHLLTPDLTCVHVLHFQPDGSANIFALALARGGAGPVRAGVLDPAAAEEKPEKKLSSSHSISIFFSTSNWLWRDAGASESVPCLMAFFCFKTVESSWYSIRSNVSDTFTKILQTLTKADSENMAELWLNKTIQNTSPVVTAI